MKSYPSKRPFDSMSQSEDLPKSPHFPQMLSLLKYTNQASPHKNRCTNAHKHHPPFWSYVSGPTTRQWNPFVSQQQGSPPLQHCLFTFCLYLKWDYNLMTVSNTWLWPPFLCILTNILYFQNWILQYRALRLLHLWNTLCCRFHFTYNCHLLPLSLHLKVHVFRTYCKN